MGKILPFKVAKAFRHLPVRNLAEGITDEMLKEYAAQPDSNVVALADRAHDVIEITELEPYDGTFIGKQIEPNGHITGYPERLKYWKQRVAPIPATSSHLFAYLREARERNICLIRGAPANVERQKTRKIKAGLYGGEDRGDHGFVDMPTRLFWFDVDGAPVNWRDDPEGAIRTVVALLGEPWASTSLVWFFSATHGLERTRTNDGPAGSSTAGCVYGSYSSPNPH